MICLSGTGSFSSWCLVDPGRALEGTTSSEPVTGLPREGPWGCCLPLFCRKMDTQVDRGGVSEAKRSVVVWGLLWGLRGGGDSCGMAWKRQLTGWPKESESCLAAVL